MLQSCLLKFSPFNNLVRAGTQQQLENNPYVAFCILNWFVTSIFLSIANGKVFQEFSLDALLTVIFHGSSFPQSCSGKSSLLSRRYSSCGALADRGLDISEIESPSMAQPHSYLSRLEKKDFETFQINYVPVGQARVFAFCVTRENNAQWNQILLWHYFSKMQVIGLVMQKHDSSPSSRDAK